MNDITISVRSFVEQHYEELCEAGENFEDILAHEVEKIVEGNYEQFQQQRAQMMQQMEAEGNLSKDPPDEAEPE